MTLLFELRNTIHGASLLPGGFHDVSQPESSVIQVPPELGNILREAAQRNSSIERWGFVTRNPVLIEPLTYSTALVEESFKFLELIASATDVQNLLPSGYTAEGVGHMREEDSDFSEFIRERLDILG
jgi:hypothetical protein